MCFIVSMDKINSKRGKGIKCIASHCNALESYLILPLQAVFCLNDDRWKPQTYLVTGGRTKNYLTILCITFSALNEDTLMLMWWNCTFIAYCKEQTCINVTLLSTPYQFCCFVCVRLSNQLSTEIRGVLQYMNCLLDFSQFHVCYVQSFGKTDQLGTGLSGTSTFISNEQSNRS